MLRIKRYVLLASAGIVLAVAAANFTLWLAEPYFIFKPTPHSEHSTQTQSLKPIDVWMKDAEGQTIHGWYFPHPNAQQVILYLHGNAGNLTDRYQELVKLHDLLHASVMSYDYQGYGKSTGHPNETNMLMDAKLAATWLAKTEHIQAQSLILLGRSMGTAVAVDLATTQGAKSLILVSPFLSLPKVIEAHYPMLAARYFLHNQFDTEAKIKRYHYPILIIHGDNDHLVPWKQGKALFDLANAPKTLYTIEGGGHFDPWSDVIYNKMHTFLQSLHTQDLQPTLILISIDGFRNSYLQQLPVPVLNQLAAEGSHAALISVFPSVTFVNHYSIATGLYPEHHGIMLNEFYAFDLKKFFTHHGHTPTVQEPGWWKGEPIWETAAKQRVLSASTKWPTTQATGKPVTYYRMFAEDGAPDERVKQILAWLDLPQEQRPRLLMLYFENLDNAAHEHGADSTEVQLAASQIDKALSALLAGLKARGIDQTVNLVIVSDHGMDNVDPHKIIDLKKYVRTEDIWAITDHGAAVGVYPEQGKLNAVYQALLKAHEPMHVYLGTDIPASLHYRFKDRTPPILCVADEQAFIMGADGHIDKGAHGYDPQQINMQGIFIAKGPAFTSHYKRPSFLNIDIYALVAHALDLKPATTDGDINAVSDLIK